MSPLLLGPHENESTFHPPVSPEMIHRPVWFIGHTVDDGPSSLYCGLYTQDRQQLVNLIINPLVSNHEYEIHFCSDAEATSDADSSLQKKCRRSFFKKKRQPLWSPPKVIFFFFALHRDTGMPWRCSKRSSIIISDRDARQLAVQYEMLLVKTLRSDGICLAAR